MFAVQNTPKVRNQRTQTSLICDKGEFQLLTQFSMFDDRSRDLKMTNSIAFDVNQIVLVFVSQFGVTFE